MLAFEDRVKLKLEEVFKLSGVPTHTFVRPVEYPRLLVALRTAGRGVVIEGPSGIGKTTSVDQAIAEIGLNDAALRLSARKKDDAELIQALPEMKDVGTVIVDDFHRLPASNRERLADFLKAVHRFEYSNLRANVWSGDSGS